MTTNILFKDLQKLTGHKLPPLSYNKPDRDWETE